MTTRSTDLDRQTLDALDWPALLDELGALARTPQGRRAALALSLEKDGVAIARLLEETGDALRLLDSGEAPRMAEIGDVGGLVVRCTRGETLDVDELRLVSATVGGLSSLAAHLSDRADLAPELARVAERIDLAPGLCGALGSAFDERGGLSEKAYPILGELRRKIAALDRKVRGTIDDLLAGGELDDVLQDRYVTVRADRLVLPIKAHAKGLGLGIVHDASRSGQTVYLEPEQVVPLNNERRLAEAELAREQARICRELSALVGTHAGSIEEAMSAATAIDLACARAALARRLDATRPLLTQEASIELRSVRHPLLVLQADEVVANDLSLTGERPVLVVTGPNAGGKTIALKTIGLCALLVRVGCFVPAAEGSRVGVLSPVLADIGDRQSVTDGLSSFSGHLRNLREMLERAAPGSLLLLDELASGTDPSQGGALARAVIERLADAGARVVVTTHYAQLKGMAASDERVARVAMEYRDGRPTYRAVAGAAGESHALEAALDAGIERPVVARARNLMDEGERALGDALAALERERARAERLAAEADALRTGLAERERKVAAREETIARRARQLEQEAAAEFVSAARRAEQQVARIVAQLQRAPSQAQAARARAVIRRLREEIEESVEQPRQVPARDPAPGDRVRIGRLGTTGVVTAVRDGEVEVQSGNLTVRVGAADLEVLRVAAGGLADAQVAVEKRAKDPPREGERATNDTAGGGLGERPAGNQARTDVQSHSRDARSALAPPARRPQDLVRVDANTLDLRGCRVGDALCRLEEFLDRATLAGLDGVFVLHGHGTEAVKKAVRQALASSPYVSDFAPGDGFQGGDGVTAVVLRA